MAHEIVKKGRNYFKVIGGVMFRTYTSSPKPKMVREVPRQVNAEGFPLCWKCLVRYSQYRAVGTPCRACQVELLAAYAAEKLERGVRYLYLPDPDAAQPLLKPARRSPGRDRGERPTPDLRAWWDTLGTGAQVA